MLPAMEEYVSFIAALATEVRTQRAERRHIIVAETIAPTEITHA